MWGSRYNKFKKNIYYMLFLYNHTQVFAIDKLLSPFDGMEYVFGNHPRVSYFYPWLTWPMVCYMYLQEISSEDHKTRDICRQNAVHFRRSLYKKDTFLLWDCHCIWANYITVKDRVNHSKGTLQTSVHIIYVFFSYCGRPFLNKYVN